jgi:lysophospholipase L1-like esterase
MMTIARIGWKKFGQRLLGLLCLVAIGIGANARMQGPSTVIPTPREAGSWWMKLHNEFLDKAKKGNMNLLFLGDSITQGWNNNEVWRRFYGPRNAENFGIGGDGTQHVLWRIQNGELEGIQPKVTVLMIGTNNVSSSTPDEIVQGITAIVKELRSRLPKTKILLLGVFPRGEKPASVRERLKAVNEKIAKLDDGAHVKFLDISQAFLNPDGTISPSVMPDFLHLSSKGYRIWAEAMEPTLWSLLDEPS